jgi:N1-aminopropylagmatine ureohydrolase
MKVDDRFWPPRNFAALDDEASDYERARAVILPVPYDSTTSARAGAREAPRAIIDASNDMELYDVVLERETYLVGIHTLPEVAPQSDSPKAMVERVESIVRELLDDGKFVVTVGGEHTMAVAPIRAYANRYPDLSVLALDAHADMRPNYLDSEYNHACTLRRALAHAPVVHVGLRSASREEHQFLRESGVPFFPAHEFRRMPDGPRQVVDRLSGHVYVTIDLDAMDPAQMAGVGTPEPGGLFWEDVTGLLEAVATERQIVGFDVMEHAPDYGNPSDSYLAAKLIYRILGLAIRE